MKKTKESIIFFGGNELQSKIMDTAAQFGYINILFDKDKNCYSKSLGNLFFPFSAENAEKTNDVLNLYSNQYFYKFIVCNTKFGKLTAYTVNDRLKIFGPKSPQFVYTEDKILPYKFIDSEVANKLLPALYNEYDVQFPAIIKPSTANGSSDVTLVNNENEFNLKMNYMKLKYGTDIIIQEFLHGEEFRGYYLLIDGRIYTLGIVQRIFNKEHIFISATTYPSTIEIPDLEIFFRMLDIDNTIVKIDFIRTSDNVINILEFDFNFDDYIAPFLFGRNGPYNILFSYLKTGKIKCKKNSKLCTMTSILDAKNLYNREKTKKIMLKSATTNHKILSNNDIMGYSYFDRDCKFRKIKVHRKKKVYFLLWSTSGRDFEICLPLVYFFEKILNWNVHYISIFNLNDIISTVPDLIIMPNTTGAKINDSIASLAKNSNILLYSHVSEGLFIEEKIDEFLWGHNKNKIFSETLSMLWSKKSYTLATKKYPYTAEQLKVSGSISHDKYVIFNNSIRGDFKGYKKIIGYAAFDFDNVILKKEIIIKNKGKDWYDLQFCYVKMINQLLEYLILKHSDILFILKNHPGTVNKNSLEIQDLKHLKNTRFVSSEYSIADLIQVSDIWLNFRSSTNIEAWLLNKPSITFCTDEPILKESKFCYGSILENNPLSISAYIDEFYKTGMICDFEKKKDIRDKIIRDSIGFSDGLNHVRFLSFLKPYIDMIENNQLAPGKWNITLRRKLFYLLKHIYYTVAKGKYKIPLLSRGAFYYDKFSYGDFLRHKKLRYPDFDDFFTSHQEEIDYIYNNYHREWKDILEISPESV